MRLLNGANFIFLIGVKSERLLILKNLRQFHVFFYFAAVWREPGRWSAGLEVVEISPSPYFEPRLKFESGFRALDL
jgi:hypothetical protein